MNPGHIDFIKVFWFVCLFFFSQSFTFAKQVLCKLSHTSSPFCSGYFGDGWSHEVFAWAGLEP
jgi:hypothetical protein